jgi:hypothetical protein
MLCCHPVVYVNDEMPSLYRSMTISDYLFVPTLGLILILSTASKTA